MQGDISTARGVINAQAGIISELNEENATLKNELQIQKRVNSRVMQEKSDVTQQWATEKSHRENLAKVITQNIQTFQEAKAVITKLTETCQTHGVDISNIINIPPHKAPNVSKQPHPAYPSPSAATC
jgi:hypothetical protein